jgi:hypothetical protein
MLAKAHILYEDSLCSGCGYPLHESMDPAHERDWHVDNPMRCHACTALESKQHQYRESDAPGALRFIARLIPRPSRGGTSPRR